MKIQMPSGHCPPIFPPLGRTLVSAVVRIVTETVTENAILRPLPSAVCFQGTLDGNDPESSHVTLGPTRVASAHARTEIARYFISTNRREIVRPGTVKRRK